MSAAVGASPARRTVRSTELAIGGMTCASCAARIETKLNKLEGVTATVNFATEKAHVSFPGTVGTDELISVIEQADYRVAVPAPPPAGAPSGTVPEQTAPDEADSLRRLLVSLVLAIPVVLLAMVPAWQFRNWQWTALVLASPVAVWGAWPFHRAALVDARHGQLRLRGHEQPSPAPLPARLNRGGTCATQRAVNANAPTDGGEAPAAAFRAVKGVGVHAAVVAPGPSARGPGTEVSTRG
jgi:copper chaperone CopZ